MNVGIQDGSFRLFSRRVVDLDTDAEVGVAPFEENGASLGVGIVIERLVV